MRVEITFAGDAVGGKEASRQIVEALKKVFAVSEETGHALSEVKITSGQATETAANARRMQDSISGVGREARQATRELERMRLAGLGGTAYGIRNVRTLGLAGLLGFGAVTSGPAGAAAGAGLAALPGLAATGGAAVGVLVAAFGGLGKAISGDRQEFEKLTPAAQEMVQTLRSLQPWLKSVQETAREGLFPGVAEGLRSALSPATANAIEDATRGIAGALGDVAKEWGGSLGSPEFARGFGDLMQHSATWVRDLGDAADHLGGALGKVTVAALPLDDWMVQGIQHGAKLLDSWVAQKQASGELAHGLDVMKGELQLVGRFAGGLGDAVFSLSRALEPLGNEILVALTAQLHSLADWIDRNRQGINNFGAGALHALEGFLETIVPLLVHMANGLVSVVNAMGGWTTAFAVVITGLLAGKIALVTANILLMVTAEKAATGQALLLRSALLGLGSPAVIAALGPLGVAIAALTITPSTTPAQGVTATYNGQTLTAIKGTGAADALMKVNRGEKLTAADITAIGTLGGQAASVKAGAGSLQLPAKFAATHNTLGADWVGRSPGFDATDLMATPGTALRAPEDGGLTRISGHDPLDAASSASHGAWGRSFYFVGDSGTVYYGTHLADVAPVGRYKKGDIIATIGAYPGGGSHVHWAIVGSGKAALGDAHMTSTQPATLATPSGGGSSRPRSGGGKSPFSAAPPFTGDKGANILPEDIRTAMALATTTGGAGDNLKATREAVAWLRANLGSFKGEDLINAYNELGGLLQQVTSLRKLIAGPPPKKGPALASAAAGLSAQTYARGLLGAIGTDVFAATPLAKATADTQAAMRAALAHLDKVEATYKPRIQKIAAEISKGLADKTLTATDLATLRARMASYGDTITGAVQRAKTAVAAQQASFQEVWARMASAAINAFNTESARFVPPSQLLLNQLNDERSKRDMQDALDAANKQMADALGSVDNSQILDAVRSTVGRYALANAIDAVQSTILGGQHADQGAGLLSELQRQLVANTVPDAEAVKAAQRAIDAAQFQIRASGLAAQAQQEQSAHDEMRAAQLAVLEAMANDWASYYNKVGGNIQSIKALWVAMLQTVDPVAAGALGAGVDSQGEPAAPLGSGLPPAAIAAIPSEAAKIAQAQYAKGKALTAAQINLIRVLKLEPNLHAAGGIAMRPTFIAPNDVIGDAGREALLPLDSPTGRAALRDAAGGGDTHVHIHGNIPDSWFTVQVEKNARPLMGTIGRRVDQRLRSNRFGGR